MNEVEVIKQQTVESGEISYEKFTLHVKAMGARAAKMKTRAWIRKNSLITPAVPKISDPEMVKESKRPLMGRNIYEIETAIWR
jgi:hypothetical protein